MYEINIEICAVTRNIGSYVPDQTTHTITDACHKAILVILAYVHIITSLLCQNVSQWLQSLELRQKRQKVQENIARFLMC